jgi:hypothetical protein
MKVKDIKEKLKHVSGNSEIVFFPEGSAEDENGDVLMPGIGYFDLESKEFVYIGDIVVIEDEKEFD